ncbi:uncharacterized protein si:ch73-127m5.2 [Corythoichthys intestinalis]|uniref:uncharacterized protein si:ch73-127m5.2 n=1 Tax=Corythoichthys intestinalis TaxID=161448 RepID=UPI0025A550D2|nr:uncharacterized protein si:ch73-127m5.2 [Corythoichthys intestinalis]XP_057682380.1 uncharacterized protein si:ch73-127m5.2 [Corythoichthys intestinalis]XP_061807348.1 uncharacterized protein LOC133598641 [Nerophis lumbriciformis]
MEQSTRVVGLDAQGNMLFTMVKPVMGIFQVSSDQTVTTAGMGLQGLAENTLLLPPPQDQVTLESTQVEMHAIQPHLQPQMEVSTQVQTEEAIQSQVLPQNSSNTEEFATQMPFAEVSSLLDPNMKGSKARKHLISYDEIKRRLQAPEKMSLRSLAAYTRVSRGPASKKTLLESLSVLGLTPSTTTSVSSSFSKLTEGDTRALCDDMKEFSHDYIDYGNMAKQLIPSTNTVQHWSKIIETKNHLEDMRKSFKDPTNSGAFDSATHGLGLGMLDVALDMIVAVIEQQIRILSGSATTEPLESIVPTRRIRRRQRRCHKTSLGIKEQGKAISKNKGRSRAKKKLLQENTVEVEPCKTDDLQGNVLTLVSVGYEAVSTGLGSRPT